MIELLEPLDPVLAIGRDLPCERMPALESEMGNRNEVRLFGVV